MMGFCRDCGRPSAPGQTFCVVCGAPLPPAAAEPAPAAGWYADGTPGQLRYWDGAGWTEHVAPDPAVAAVAPPPRGRGSVALVAVALVGAVVVGGVIVWRGSSDNSLASGSRRPGGSPSASSPAPASTPPVPPATTPVVPKPRPSPPLPLVIGSVDITAVAGDSAAAGIAQSIGTYFDGINSSDYQAAFAVLSPAYRAKHRLTVGAWSSGLHTTQDTSVRVLRLTPTASGAAVATVSFTSRQAASDGYQHQTCTRWLMDYTVRPSMGYPTPYLIEAVKRRSARAC